MATLADIANGESARVNAIRELDEVSQRLLEMGLTPGIEIRRIGAAPLGDPIEFELRGYRLSLRRNEAARVDVVNKVKPDA
jgi:ferrous iron transport protein A